MLVLVWPLLASCWSDRSGTSASTRVPAPEPRTMPVPPLPSPKQYAMSDGVALAHDLRDADTSHVIAGMAGPVVTLDLGSGQLATLCGDSVPEAIARWTQLLTDEARNEPSCRSGGTSGFICSQSDATASGNVLILYFSNTSGLKLEAASLGSTSTASWPLGDTAKAMKERVASATCP